MSTRTVEFDERDVYGQVNYTHSVPCTCFKCFVLVRDKDRSPCWCCSGRDEEKRLQIRLEKDSTVYISWRDADYDMKGLECMRMPYEEFYEWIVQHLRERLGKEPVR